MSVAGIGDGRLQPLDIHEQAAIVRIVAVWLEERGGGRAEGAVGEAFEAVGVRRVSAAFKAAALPPHSDAGVDRVHPPRVHLIELEQISPR